MPNRVLPSSLEAVSEVASFLEETQVPYVIIGGLAVEHWGEPRATRDVDVTVLVPPQEEEQFGSRLSQAKKSVLICEDPR